MDKSQVYDPKQVRAIINGLDATGYADGEKIKVEPVTKEEYKSHVGVDGDVSFSKNHDDRYNITLVLKRSSPFNATLDAFRKSGVSLVVAIKNTSAGKYLGGGSNGRIMERPGTTFGAEDDKREWKIQVPNYSDAIL